MSGRNMTNITSLPSFHRQPGWVRVLFVFAGLLGLIPLAHSQTTITVDSATHYQTITGWECVLFAAQDTPECSLFQGDLLDRLVNEAGINRFRLEVRAGAENSADDWGQLQAGSAGIEKIPGFSATLERARRGMARGGPAGGLGARLRLPMIPSCRQTVGRDLTAIIL
jgi:hypothetical protein